MDIRLQKLIEHFYESVGDASAWCGLANRVANTFDSTSVVLKMHDANSHVHLVETTDNLLIAAKDKEWADYWHRNDLWVERGLASGLSRIHTSQSLLARTEYERSGFYQDWLRKLDIYHMVGSVFPVAADTTGVLGIHRPRGADAYDNQESRLVAQLLPHLQRTLRMHKRLTELSLQQMTAFDVFDRLNTGVVIVDSRCRLLYANTAAEDVLRRETLLTVIDNRLSVTEPRFAEQLRRRVQQAVLIVSGKSASPAALLLLPRAEGLPITVSVEPLHSRWSASVTPEPAAILFICDPESLIPGQEGLRALFGLTATEATIAATLATGKSPEEVAAIYGIGIGTVRSHLKKILAKTGTRRQSQLVTLILRSAIALSHPFHSIDR